MNRPLIFLLLKHSQGLVLKGSNTATQNGQFFRSIHNYVRPMRYALRYRKIREAKMNPVPKAPDHRNTYTDWNYNAEIFAFGKRLNEEIDDALMRQAFTDRSFVTKEKLRQEELGLNTEELQLKDNQYLSTEGENILRDVLVTTLRYEFPRFPEDGIQALVQYLASETLLAHISTHIGTKDLIQCVEIPPTKETLARAFLAIISAIEKSSGHERVKTFIHDFVVPQIYDKDINEIWNVEKPWAMLTDILRTKGETFEARLIREAGKNTLLSVFIVGLYSSEKKLIGTGTGETVEIAQEMAARDALSIVFETRFPRPTFKFLAARSHKSNLDAAETPQLKARS